MLNLTEEYLFRLYKVRKKIHSSVGNLLHRTDQIHLEKIVFYEMLKGYIAIYQNYNSAIKLIFRDFYFVPFLFTCSVDTCNFSYIIEHHPNRTIYVH